ncbi:hypothetical protein AV530_002205 [Patagioenas fasciata monilis]|uniref:Secreted protein n=1 Tax=Patagioenas fasciata monilis TaxID=372326 RepID=A0A1V4K739_PATFA|nr:hypothetical protein AV530_002205 [Patagioenas fasciata monilis]
MMKKYLNIFLICAALVFTVRTLRELIVQNSSNCTFSCWKGSRITKAKPWASGWTCTRKSAKNPEIQGSLAALCVPGMRLRASRGSTRSRCARISHRCLSPKWHK